MSSYELGFTDINVPIVLVDMNTIDNVSLDITLFGFTKLNYGRELNENFVHILEHFAVPQDSSNPGNPNLFQVSYDGTGGSNALLSDPVTGQVWYNKTQSELRPYVWYNTVWNPLENFGQDVAANWGQIADGEQIPQPVSETGYVFPYEECSWIVSPFNQVEELVDMECLTDENAIVTMKYLYNGDSSQTSGIANYMIVGLKDNNNLGDLSTPEPQPSATPTPTPSTSQGASPTPTPTNTPTPTPTPTPSQSSGAAPPPMVLNMLDPYEAQCAGSCTATYTITPGVDFTISGGTGSYSYDWDFIFGSSFSIANSSSASPTFSRYRSEGDQNIVGTGNLTVFDNITGNTVSQLFQFITDHNLVDVTPTPTPTSSTTPTPTSSNTPTPTPTPTPTSSVTPTPTPSNSVVYDPLNVSAVASLENDSESGCDGSEISFYWDNTTLSSALTITGGSGNYTITGLPTAITKTVQCSLPDNFGFTTYLIDSITVSVEDDITGETAGPFNIALVVDTQANIPFA